MYQNNKKYVDLGQDMLHYINEKEGQTQNDMTWVLFTPKRNFIPNYISLLRIFFCFIRSHL